MTLLCEYLSSIIWHRLFQEIGAPLICKKLDAQYFEVKWCHMVLEKQTPSGYKAYYRVSCFIAIQASVSLL